MASGGRGSPGNKGGKGLAARAYANKALGEVLRNSVPLEDALGESWRSDLAANDKALVRAIVATSLRHKGQIDDVLRRFLNKPLPAKSGPAREILLSGAAQILFMRVPAHAAIDVAVSLARHDRNGKHFSGLINAVLRKVAASGPDVAAGQDSVELNIPKWMHQAWAKDFGADVAANMGAALLKEAPLDITIKGDVEDWAQKLGGKVLPGGTVRLENAAGRIEDLHGYGEGAWWVQDAAAALPVKLLGDLSGKKVLDLCAAPGGKTAQLAAAGADVTAVDNSPARLEILAGNLKRLELSAQIVCHDAATFEAHEGFDVVLADVPCSATGTLRRHPDGLHTKQASLPEKLKPVQLAILHNAISRTRAGGRTMLCTCSVQMQEGERLIEEILAESTAVTRDRLTQDEVFGLGHLINSSGDLRVLPHHPIGDGMGLDGFFASRLLKN